MKEMAGLFTDDVFNIGSDETSAKGRCTVGFLSSGGQIKQCLSQIKQCLSLCKTKVSVGTVVQA